MTYSDDNTTTFSDRIDQQQTQTFSQNEYMGAYEPAAPLGQGEEGLWFDQSAALLPVDGLAGVGQALHLADAFAGRVGAVGANVLLEGRGEHKHAAMEFSSMDVTPPSGSNQLIPTHGEFHAVPNKANDWSGFLKAEDCGIHMTSSMVSLQSPIDTSDGEGPFKCTICNKPKRRQCELK